MNITSYFSILRPTPIGLVSRFNLISTQQPLSALYVIKYVPPVPRYITEHPYYILQVRTRSDLLSYKKPPVDLGMSSVTIAVDATSEFGIRPYNLFSTTNDITVETTSEMLTIPIRLDLESDPVTINVTATSDLTGISQMMGVSTSTTTITMPPADLDVVHYMSSSPVVVEVVTDSPDAVLDVIAIITPTNQVNPLDTVLLDLTTTTEQGTTSLVFKNVSVSIAPSDAAFDDGQFLITAGNDNAFDAIESVGLTVTDAAVDSAGLYPTSISYMSDKDEYAVINSSDASISIIDATSNTISSTFPTGTSYPSDSLYVETEDMLVVANVDSHTVTLWDATTHSKIVDIAVGDTPTKLVYNANKNEIAVICKGDYTVHIINLVSQTNISNIQVEDSPSDIIYIDDDNSYWVTCQFNSNVFVIDETTHNILHEIQVGNQPVSLDYATGSYNTVLVTNNGSGTVSFIDTTTHAVVDTSPAYGVNPADVVYMSDRERFVVAYEDSNKIITFNPTTFEKETTQAVIDDPYKMVYDEVTNLLLVLSRYNSVVTFVNSYNL